MSKPTISIKQLNEDHTPIKLVCEDMDEANFKFEVLQSEIFIDAVEIELKDASGQTITSTVKRPN